MTGAIQLWSQLQLVDKKTVWIYYRMHQWEADVNTKGEKNKMTLITATIKGNEECMNICEHNWLTWLNFLSYCMPGQWHPKHISVWNKIVTKLIKVGTGVNIPDNKDNASLSIAAGVKITNDSVSAQSGSPHMWTKSIRMATMLWNFMLLPQGAIFERMKIISFCHHLNHFGDHY